MYEVEKAGIKNWTMHVTFLFSLIENPALEAPECAEEVFGFRGRAREDERQKEASPA